MRLTLSLFLRLMQALVVGAATAVVTFVEVRHHAPGALVATCACVLGIGGTVDPATRAIANEVGEVSFETRLRVEQPLWALVVAVADLGGSLSFSNFGATAFLVRRTRRHPFRGVQVRTARARVQANPHPTEIVWTWRKGLLGQCWRQRCVVGMAHTDRFGTYRSMQARQWRQVAKATRMKLRHRDMVQIASYGYVEAHPMIDSATGTYRGCLVVQVPERNEMDVKQPEVQDLIEVAASEIARIASN